MGGKVESLDSGGERSSRGRSWNCWSQGGKGHEGSRERGWNRPSQREVKRTEELVGGGDIAGVRGVMKEGREGREGGIG